MAKLRIGIVGTGFIAGFHFDGFRKNPDTEVVGMCTHSNQEKLHQMCNQWGIKPYPTFDALVEDSKVDALVIGSVNHEHFPQIMKSISLGKPTLVEKPVVTDIGHLDQTPFIFNSEMVEPDADYANSFVNQAQAFTDCIFKGKPPVSDLDDVRNTLKIIYGAYESSERDSVISITN